MDVFKTLILDTPAAEGATGTVTSVDLTAGTGISVSGGPITNSGSITVTNTSPDQTVALTGGTGISTSGTYPNFTITNDAPDQTVSIAAGTGISVTGSYPSFTVTNSSPSLGGDVVGPASATDNAVVRFDSTTGKLIQNSGVSISDANLLTTTALTVNENTTLGSSNTDTVNFNARVASDINPATDNTYDLGVTGHEWRNLNIDGTANIDSLVADTADINGGTIDGTAIGGSTAAAGAFTTLSATGQFTTGDGTVSAPSHSFTNDADCGLYRIGTNNIGAAVNGAKVLDVSTTGLAVTGNLTATGLTASGHDLNTSGSGARLQIFGGTHPSFPKQAYLDGDAIIMRSAAGAERLRIDSSGNVGIGTTSPTANLEVGGSGNQTLRVGATSNSYAFLNLNAWALDRAQLRAEASNPSAGSGTGAGKLTFFTASAGSLVERMAIDGAGNVGIGTASPSYLLDVNGTFRASGDVRFPGVYNNTTGASANVLIAGDGGNNLYRSTSSIRYKKDVTDYTRKLNDLQKLRPVFYKGKNVEVDKDKQFAGFIAEEVDAAGLSEFVIYDNDGRPDALAYSNMVALLVSAVKELKAEIDALKAND